MPMLAGQLALVVAAIFTGAAVYITVAEHPARLKLEDGPLLAQWQPSHKRDFAMQASLAVVGFLLGLWAWSQTGDWRWGLGALALVANWPSTLIAIMPVNKRLTVMSTESPGDDPRTLKERWGRLHAVRSALGAMATAIFLWQRLDRTIIGGLASLAMVGVARRCDRHPEKPLRTKPPSFLAISNSPKRDSPHSFPATLFPSFLHVTSKEKQHDVRKDRPNVEPLDRPSSRAKQ